MAYAMMLSHDLHAAGPTHTRRVGYMIVIQFLLLCMHILGLALVLAWVFSDSKLLSHCVLLFLSSLYCSHKANKKQGISLVTMIWNKQSNL